MAEFEVHIAPQDGGKIYVNQFFQVLISLTTKTSSKGGCQPICGVRFELLLELVFQDGTPVKPRSPGNAAIMEVKPERPFLNHDGFSKDVEVKLLESSQFHRNRPFFLRVSKAPKPPRFQVEPALSTAMRAIHYSLGFVKAIPKKWYKDQGGRDNHMDLQLQLRDGEGQPVMCCRKTRVDIKLLYKKSSQRMEELTVVPNQKILKMLPTSKREINVNGQVSIKFRIDDVSKNHMKRDFHIQVVPHVLEGSSRDDFSLAGDISSGVSVLSKVNGPRGKRGRVANDLTPKPGSFSHEIQTGKDKPVMNAMQAANGYKTWMVATKNILTALQWRCFGFEYSKLVGNGERLDIDYTRPIYSCPSCKAIIDTDTYNRCKIAGARQALPLRRAVVQDQLLALHRPECAIASMLKRFKNIPAWSNLSRTLGGGQRSMESTNQLANSASTGAALGLQSLQASGTSTGPEKQRELKSSAPPVNLHRILAADTLFFANDKVGELMYPAFDVAGNLLGFVLGQQYYPKNCYDGLDAETSLVRMRTMLEKTRRELNYTLNDPRGPSTTPTELVNMVSQRHQGWKNFCIGI